MLDFFYHYGLFAAKTLTFVLAIGFVIALITTAATKQKRGANRLVLEDVSADLRQQSQQLQLACALNDHERKQLKQQFKAVAKADKKASDDKARLYVLDFNGSMDAHEVSGLSREITGLLQLAKAGDDVLVRLESGGGVVHGYGLGAAELARIKAHGLHLTVAVDKVAASGGYMMACVAERIIAAPFAIVGSIGVVAQMPNFNKFLKNKDIDVELHTAGAYKRTLTLFGENDDAGRAKFQEELEVIHHRFKDFIAVNRPALALEKVATGEHWLGTDALELGLVDELSTSSEYLLSQSDNKRVIRLHYQPKKNLKEKLTQAVELGISRAVLKFISAAQRPFS
ncbi:protease SohB [Oceanisphaera profunda]|uniref:Protease SohB n=1 Tax=Oceanisphaera profunda TaxID=1416627 RepID=A0A1Y0D1X3_9GAMM|nr:protease SohB [Oceanisphaera profunda]ART81508.1 protease SohB [Oceanisphaera profunda]